MCKCNCEIYINVIDMLCVNVIDELYINVINMLCVNVI